jgi:hypothetical protein
MAAGLAKLGASIGLAAGLAFVPLMERVEVERPSVLYAMAYFQALLGNTNSAIKIAERAAKSETVDAEKATLTRQCAQPCSF